MLQSHPYRSLRMPPDAPFELKPSPGKGWGAFATRRIERGATILREKALFVIRKPHQKISEADLWTAFEQLEPSEKQQFLYLRHNGSWSFTQMRQAFAENSFAIPNSIGGLPGNVPLVHGLFLIHSRFNHSCVPNCMIPDKGEETIASFATKDIVAGEEITFCYNSDFESIIRKDRHQALRFVCDCKACIPGTPFQQMSDIRRTFIRGLLYLTLGVDLDGKKRGPESPIIADPQLKKAAEEFTVTLTSRLIYNLLIVCLLEEEGLLDGIMFAKLNERVLTATALLRTESNIRIAKLAVAQETNAGKLCIAMKLHERDDAADPEIFMALQQLSRHSAHRRSRQFT